MNELENHIQHYFSISPDDCKKVAGLFRIETMEKGTFWLKAGRYCNKMSFIQQGLFRVYVIQEDKEITQWIGTGGYFITDVSSFMLRSLSRFNIHALTDTTLFTIDLEQYETLGKIVPKWNELEKLFICKCFVTIENRVLDLISMSAEERYKQLFEQNKELFNLVPLQYLASMLGMTPETFSRIRRKMIS